MKFIQVTSVEVQDSAAHDQAQAWAYEQIEKMDMTWSGRGAALKELADNCGWNDGDDITFGALTDAQVGAWLIEDRLLYANPHYADEWPGDDEHASIVIHAEILDTAAQLRRPPHSEEMRG